MLWQSYQVCIALLLTKITTFDLQVWKEILIFYFLEQMDGLDKAVGFGEDRRQASARGAKSDGFGNDRFVGAGEDRRQASARGAKFTGIGNDRDGCRDNKC